ncbi:MAG TPA: glycosyltransferase family 4 protein [Tepidisphaeraceae bacterium]|jgi:glycosyltransferase involved in cell wall biosynthesis
MRVLLLADDCNPDWPSLPVVGYKACRGIADHCEAVVATHIRNKLSIERDGLGKAQVVYIDNEYIAAPMYKAAKVLRGGSSVGWTTNIAMSYPSYLAFEHEVYQRFGHDLRHGRFDIVHRVTPMSPTIPSPLAQWTDVPFVLGPLNGGLRWPKAFTQELKREKEWLTYIRNVYRAMPYYRGTYSHSAAVLAAFQHTVDDLPRSALPKTIDLPEVGIDTQLFDVPMGQKQPGRQAIFLFVGRLVPYKCADVVIAAFAQSQKLQEHRLKIIGDGPERPRMQEMVREHNLGRCVEFVGWCDQKQVGAHMRYADVFAFPSIRELGAGVVVEAMACGLPCIVVDYGGPGGLIFASHGVKVPLGNKEQLVESFRREMEALADDFPRRQRLGAAAHRYALDYYSWDAKARQVMEVYQWVLGRRPDKPDFVSRREGKP